MVVKMYQKEIIYMSLYENDIKNSCVGYLKLEKKQEQFALELQVKKIPESISGSFPVRLQVESGWQEADMFAINDGMGRWTGWISEQVLRIEVILSDYYKIKGQSKKVSIVDVQNDDQSSGVQETAPKREPSSNLQSQTLRPKSSSSLQSQPFKPEPLSSSQEQSFEQEQPLKLLPPMQQPQEQPSKPEPSPKTQAQMIGVELPVRAVTAIKREQPVDQENTPLYESKWEQLLATYEQIHPYGDSRVYLKIKPKDFIVLRANYQHLVNNSFLLHGFYNYRYLILGKEKDFYLGVPGVFYEREKMVALMFGFEAFECEGGNAEEGKFGYYLRKVEL